MKLSEFEDMVWCQNPDLGIHHDYYQEYVVVFSDSHSYILDFYRISSDLIPRGFFRFMAVTSSKWVRRRMSCQKRSLKNW